MQKSILGLLHLLLAILTLSGYIGLAVVLLYQKVTTVKKHKLVRVFALTALIGVFLLVDTGFYMHRFDQILSHTLHHPMALGALFCGGAASILAIVGGRRPRLADWALYLSVITAVLCVLTSLFTAGK